MTAITKAALAAELGITRARMSQYSKRGLPQRPDGKLNRDEALNWIAENCRAQHHDRDAGVNRARRIVKSAPVEHVCASPPVNIHLANGRPAVPVGFEWVERMKND